MRLKSKFEQNRKVVSNFSSVLLQTTDYIIYNNSGDNQIRRKILFDQCSQKTYVTNCVKVGNSRSKKVGFICFNGRQKNDEKWLFHVKISFGSQDI